MAGGQKDPVPMSAECLDESRILRFLDGTISDNSRTRVEAHVASCSACAELTTWAAADQANRSRSVGRERRPFVG
jgi:anti-sigma factor RsiW